ncbi:MAG: helix-turn-helix domain-containing protein [Candidatus Competibacteraceae bacterium]|jgi:excisionase family DNA binding protein|nr:helix-turn-helix domain-containing protein [Candidatus Competibacteraceae bacterium]
METYTPEQAAKIIQVHPQTLRKWLRTGKITGSDTPAGWRLTPDDIQKWLDKYRNKESA